PRALCTIASSTNLGPRYLHLIFFGRVEGETVGPHAPSHKEESIRCVLVHDHVLLRQALRCLIDDEADIKIVAEAGSAAEALRMIFEYRPQVVIADVHMFECDPDQAERLMLKESPHSKVVFLTAHDDEGEEDRASAHQTGYVMRQTSVPEFLEM